MSGHNPGFLKCVEIAKQSVPEISIDDFSSLKNGESKPVIIDVREDHEVDDGSMPDALHIGKGVIDRDLETAVPDKTTPIIFFCRSGYRSLIAAHQAQTMGYQNICSLQGGYRAWCLANGVKAPESPFSEK